MTSELFERDFSVFRPAVSGKYGVIKKIAPVPSRPGDVPFFGYECKVGEFRRIDGFNLSSGSSHLFSPSTAILAALGEGLERYSTTFWRHIPHIENVTFDELEKNGRPALSPQDLQMFDEQQYQHPRFKLKRFAPDFKTTWLQAFSHRDQRAFWLPRALSLCNFTLSDIWFGTTNGNALAMSWSEAQLKAFFELIERDTFLCHWWNRIPGRPLDLSSVPQALLEKVSKAYGAKFQNVRILVFESDLKLPVLVSIFRDDSNRGPAISMAGSFSLDPAQMFERACAELPWCRLGTTKKWLRPVREFSSDFNASITSLSDTMEFYSRPENSYHLEFLFNDSRAVKFNDLVDRSQLTIEQQRQWLMNHLTANGVHPLTVDLTTRDLKKCGLYVARAYAPEMIQLNLEHIYRPINISRLKRLKQNLGLASREMNFDDFNSSPHPFP